MKTNKLILLVCIALPAPLAASGVGTASGLFLRQEPTARVTSMGGVTAAIDNDAGAVYANPASLVYNPATQLSLSTWKGVDAKSRANFVSAIYNADKRGVFDVSYIDYDSGKEDIYDMDGNGSSVNLSQEYALGLGWGYKVADHGAVGAQLKYVNSTLAENYKARTVGIDLGGRYNFYSDRISVGAGLQNMGGKLKYISDADPLPRIIYGGAAMRFDLPKGNLLVSAELQKPGDQSAIDPHIGAEYTLDILALRAGAKHEPGQSSFTLGAGIKLKWFSFDYGFQSQGDLNEPVNKFTLNVFFDAFTAKRTTTALAPETGGTMTAVPADETAAVARP